METSSDNQYLWSIFEDVETRFWATTRGQAILRDYQIDLRRQGREQAVILFERNAYMELLITANSQVTNDVFLTLNPPNNKSLDDLLDVMQRLEELFPSAYLYSYEATDNAGRCPHVHILFHHEYQGNEWAKFYRRLTRITDRVCVSTNKHAFALRHVLSGDVENVIKYILKTRPPKNGADRLKRQATDSLREENGLAAYYSNYEEEVLTRMLTPAIAD